MSVIDSSEIPETRLKELRESRNLSQEEVAKKVGVSVREYSKWEENSEGIPLEKIACLSNFYEVSNDYILKISDDDTSPEPIEVEINNNMVVQRIGQVMLEKELNMDFDV